MILSGFESDLSAVREIIYCAAVLIPGALNYAHQLFDRISHPDLFLWNTLIRGSAHGSSPLDAISLFLKMENYSFPCPPDKYTFPFLLKAAVRLSCSSLGDQIHGKIVKHGLESDGFVRNALINFHASCGDMMAARLLLEGSAAGDVVALSAMIAGHAKRGELEEARALFDRIPFKDLISWNVMITGYTRKGDMNRARELFNAMHERDVVSWNAVISGYVDSGEPGKAIEVFEEMCSSGDLPDEVTMLSLLSACGQLGALATGARLHAIVRSRSIRLTTTLSNALIGMYARCGSIECAMDVFHSMPERDISTWNSVIDALARHGRSNDAVRVFDEMQQQRIRPDEVTFVSVLAACSHGGLVEEGRRSFNLLREYSIAPNVKHLGCMVDMLGRAGFLREAFLFADQTGAEESSVVWRAFLGACRTHGEVRLAELANARLVRDSSGGESGDYVLLSNTYAAVGEWNAVEETRKLMDEKGVPKAAGHSSVQTVPLRNVAVAN